METLELLQRAASEIRGLRKQNEIMSARLEMFDSMMVVLHTEPAHKGGGAMHPDPLFELEKAIQKLENPN